MAGLKEFCETGAVAGRKPYHRQLLSIKKLVLVIAAHTGDMEFLAGRSERWARAQTLAGDGDV